MSIQRRLCVVCHTLQCLDYETNVLTKQERMPSHQSTQALPSWVRNFVLYPIVMSHLELVVESSGVCMILSSNVRSAAEMQL